MAPPAAQNARALKGFQKNKTFITEAVKNVVRTYYDPKYDIDQLVSSETGFCLEITPTRRRTASPTGGVVGRWLARRRHSSSTTMDEDSLGSGSSSSSSPHHARTANSIFSIASTQAVFDVYQDLTPVNKLSPEDDNFVFKYQNNGAIRVPNAYTMHQLIPVHKGRPGEHILRWDIDNQRLYLCIPTNPYAPSSDMARQQEYKLRTYDSYLEDSNPAKASTTNGEHNTARAYKKPYPAKALSSLTTCNHCHTPRNALQNTSLCPFHAYFIATGKFIGYYQFCAVAELENRRLSFATGWWEVEEMVEFVDSLTDVFRQWLLIESSEPIIKDTWISKASPYGAVGEEVPQNAKRKSPRDIRMQQLLLRTLTSHDGDEEQYFEDMGPRLEEAYQQAIHYDPWNPEQFSSK